MYSSTNPNNTNNTNNATNPTSKTCLFLSITNFFNKETISNSNQQNLLLNKMDTISNPDYISNPKCDIEFNSFIKCYEPFGSNTKCKDLYIKYEICKNKKN